MMLATDLLPALAEAAEEVLEDAAESFHLSSGGRSGRGAEGLVLVIALVWLKI